MKHIKSISYNHTIPSSSLFTKIFLFLILNILIVINCEENIDKNIIDNNDLFLILEKDGILRAFDKTETNEKWKLFFNNSIFPKITNSYKFTDDIVIYPINDKLYLSIENNFVPFDIFVINLINNKPIAKNNIKFEGQIEKYFYKINIKSGKILEKINNNNFNIESNLKKDAVILKKVNYFLIKKEKNENLMNISYSDINIEVQNDENNNNNMNDMHHIINYFKLNLEIGKIISIHTYNYNKGKLTLIYDKNILEKKFNSDKAINTNNFNNNKNTENKETNYFKELYDDILIKLHNISNNLRNYFFILLIVLIIIILKIKPNVFIINFNKTDIINENYNYKFPENINSNNSTSPIANENSTSNINNSDDNKNNKNINNKEICHKINNFSIISKPEKLEISEKIEINATKKENNPTENMKKYLSTELSIVKKLNFNELVPKSYSSPKLLPSEENKDKLFFDPNNNLDLEELKNDEFDYVDDNYFKNLKISRAESKNKYPKINGNFNDILKILNSKNTILNKQSVDINELGKFDEHNYYISFKINTEHIYNCKVPNDEMPKFMTNNKFLGFQKNLLPDENLKNIEKKIEKFEKIGEIEEIEKIEEIDEIDEIEDNYSKKSTKEKTNNSNKSEKKCGAGIWDDDEDEEEDAISENINNDKEKYNNTNNITNISISESKNISKSNNKKEINDSAINLNLDKDNKNMKNSNELINKSRLDKDFKNLEKIGKGGFGIVLKGEHRLDKGICAIKIIKLKDINDKESIINEAITMTKVTSKHVVQYKTCWIDNNLGTASKLFNDEEEDDDEIGDLSLHMNNSTITKKNDKLKTIKNNMIIDDEDDENEEENDEDTNNNDLSLSRKISNLYFGNKNDSQELKKKGSKYCCNYRDDSHIITKSIISSKYIKENSAKSENINEGEYFFILMEYCDGLTLEKYIKQYAGKSIDRKIIYNFTSQILKSLVKIHSTGIIHRDIKPCNIFIKNDQIKIGDFGLATRYSNTGKLLKSKKIEGTPLYLSPEQKNFKTYNEKVDIYACGITLYEMCSCFSTEMERCNDILSLKNENKINERVSKNYPEESALIKLMTKNDYNERPSAKEILESELFIKLGKTLGC